MHQDGRRSYWAMPSAASADWLGATIARFAANAGTRPFVPHLTLVGEVPQAAAEHVDVERALADACPFDVSFVAVDDEDVRYRCVTLRAEPGALVEVRARLLEALAHAPADPYRPHLSLLYGDLPRRERRRLIEAAALPAELPRVTVDAVASWDTSAADWSAWRELDRWAL